MSPTLAPAAPLARPLLSEVAVAFSAGRSLAAPPALHPQAQACGACPLRRDALFGALDEAALAEIHVVVDRPSLAADEALFRQGQSGSAVYTIHQGLLRLERGDPSGERRILRVAGPGELVGLEALLQQPHANDAIACTPLQLCRVPAALVHSLTSRHRPLALELMRRWQQALQAAEDWTTQMSTGSAERRMVAVVRQLARHAGPDGRIWLPRREELGAMLNMTLETASRQVSRLRRAGVLSDFGLRDARVHPERLAEAWAQARAG